MSSLLLRRGALRGAGAIPPTNAPPVWDSTPAPVGVNGTPSTYSLQDLVTDPEGDTVDIGINSGIVPLPTGWTYDTVANALEFDGAGDVGTSSGHSSNANDGNGNVVSSGPYDIVTQAEPPPPPPTGEYPQYKKHAQWGVNVAGYATNMQTEPYRTWNSKKDGIFIQHRYPSTAQVADEVADSAWFAAQNSALVTMYYSFNTSCSPVSGTAKYMGYEAMVTNNNALSEWRAYDSSTGTPLEFSNEVAGNIPANTNFENTDPGSLHANFAVAFWAHTNFKYNSQWPWSGRFYDSMDHQDAFPKWKLASDGTTNGDVDYDRPFSSGNTNPATYRTGILYDIATLRTYDNDQIVIGNSGRAATSVNTTLENNEWAGEWDGTLIENVQSKLRLEHTDNDGNFYITGNNPDANLIEMVQAALIGEALVDKTVNNRLNGGDTTGICTVIMDVVMEWSQSANGGADMVLSDVKLDHYRYARFVAGLCMLHHTWVAGPNMSRGEWPFPPLDEFAYDCGDPIGGPMVFATIAEPWRFTEPVIRAADIAAVSGQFGVYFAEYDNVLWVINLNEPAGNSFWNSAASDLVILPSADLGGGEVWRRPDAASYVHPTRTQGITACAGQDTALNDGSLATQTNIQRWTSEMFVRSAS